MARLTIAVLNYNYARYLAEAVESALAQTHDDVEVVVVDDGSTDGSVELIRGWGDRVTACCKVNGGQGSAMNAALEVATGDVVIFLDADDLLDPDVGEHVMHHFGAVPDTAWLMFRLRIVDGEGRPTGRVRPRRPGVMPDGDLRRHVARYRCFHWQPTSGNAFATAALRQVMPMPEQDYRISADAYLAGTVVLCGSVHGIDDVGGSYRRHGGSNYSSRTVDAAWFRTQIAHQLTTHAQAVDVARRVGVDLPDDPDRPLDVAHLSFRLASLVLDPAAHPVAGDRRRRLVPRAFAAALLNPEIAWPSRLRRAAWVVLCGATWGDLAYRAAQACPDTPGPSRLLAPSAI